MKRPAAIFLVVASFSMGCVRIKLVEREYTSPPTITSVSRKTEALASATTTPPQLLGTAGMSAPVPLEQPAAIQPGEGLSVPALLDP